MPKAEKSSEPLWNPGKALPGKMKVGSASLRKLSGSDSAYLLVVSD
jgi:hypothetical protein